jgi:hypothetical protein
MDRHDKSLLDKQLWGVSPNPPSLIGLALVAVFFGGLVVGSVLFTRERHANAISNDVTGSISAQKSQTKWPLLNSYSQRPLAP